MLEALRGSTARLPRRRSHAGEAPRVCGLSVATPPRSFEQDEMLALLGLAGDEFAEGIFARCGVRRRHLSVTPSTLRSTLQERTPATEEQHLRLAEDAIDGLELGDPAEVGVVVTASYYALGGPTPAHRIVDRYRMDAGTDKYHLVGVGCASAVPLFRLAGQALRDRPGRKALVLASESVSGFLTAVRPGDGKVKVVGSALFGDGCGAALLAGGHDEPGPAVLATAVHQVPGTLDHVRFAVSGADSHMEISRELPEIAEAGLRPLVEEFLRAQGLGVDAIDHWLVHPGGRGIVEAVQRGLLLSDEQVEPSMHVLSEYGNVGTPSAFFVLKATTERRRPATGDHGLMVTIGPGVTIGLMLLAW
ncbi:MAG: 3-oxoacyl-[acyl-carrier-protein] synthase III C-terminal domain-containing protein [Thermoleophilaceae bacterium]